MATAKAILDIAKAQIGTKATNYRVCKYNTWFYGKQVSGNDYHWCAVFVCWCFNQAKALNLLGGSAASALSMPVALRSFASCGYLAKAFMDRGQLTKPKTLAQGMSASDLKIGDVVFFHWSTEKSTLIPGTYVSDHVGIIEKVNSDGTIQTVEGNTGDLINGQVLRRVRSISVVSCTAHPKYATAVSIKGKKGVDISYANGNIDLSKVKKAGYDYVMIRCGYGSNIKDQDDAQFESNAKKAESLGMPWGVYLFSYATNQKEAKSEVEHIIRLLKNKKPTLPIALDVEAADYYKKHNVYNKASITAIVSTILKGIKAAGLYPMLYTGKYWLDGYDGVTGVIDKSVWSKYDIWLASWTKKCTYSGSNLGFWQYGGETNLIESNSIPGVGVIDKDLAYKDYPKIIMDGGYNGWAKGSGGDTPTPPKYVIPDMLYRVRAGGKWFKEVDNLSSYAGKRGVAITDVAIKASRGRVKYRVHVKGGGWLPYVSGYNTSDAVNGYAGNGKQIDAVEIYYYTPTDVFNEIGGSLRAEYRVSPVGGNYYDWQFDNEVGNGQDGYAGSFGKSIDRLQLTLCR